MLRYLKIIAFIVFGGIAIVAVVTLGVVALLLMIIAFPLFKYWLKRRIIARMGMQSQESKEKEADYIEAEYHEIIKEKGE